MKKMLNALMGVCVVASMAYAAGTASSFAQADTNKDGSLSADEMNQSYEKRQKAMQGSRGPANSYKN